MENRPLKPDGRRRSGIASAKAKQLRGMGVDPNIIREHSPDAKVNEENTVKNLRSYILSHPCKAIVLLLVFFSLNAPATISPGFPDKLVWNPSPTTNVTYQILRGTGTNTWTATNSVGTNLFLVLTNIDFGTWWFAARAVSTNGVFSDRTPSIPWTNAPDPPVGLGIQSTSSGTADIWLPFPYSSGIVESAPDPDGLWTPFFQMKNLSADPAKAVGLRIGTMDPRKNFRVTPPALPAGIRKPPSP